MPRRPKGNPAIATLKRSVFSELLPQILAHTGPIYPLHVGDTYLPPPPGAHLADQTEAVERGIHRYASPRGRKSLIDAVVETRRARDGVPVEPGQVLITVGATGALSAAVRALLVPGQQVLILAPYWPLIKGMCVSHGIDVVEVPFYDRVDDAAAARSVLEAAVTARTAAICVNSPNNPSGRVSPPEVVAELAAFAQRHDLWLFTDEVYESYRYGAPTLPMAAVEEVRHRTVAAYSFSKAYGMAGNRVGYIVAPSEVAARIEQMTTYLIYSSPNGGQRAAQIALLEGDEWLQDAAARYAQAGRRTAERLGVAPPQGGTFLFLDVAAHLDDRGIAGLLRDCLAEGLVLTPGEVFGAAYGTFVRLCFTSAPPDAVEKGVDILARRLGR